MENFPPGGAASVEAIVMAKATQLVVRAMTSAYSSASLFTTDNYYKHNLLIIAKHLRDVKCPRVGELGNQR